MVWEPNTWHPCSWCHHAHMLWASLPGLLCPSPLEGLAHLCIFQLNPCPFVHHPSVPCTCQVTAHCIKSSAFTSVWSSVSRDPADVSSESDSAMTSSTVSKLAEARRTTYLSGRWVCDDHNGDTSISITGPWISLPNNGDYSAYYNWVEEKKTTQGPGEKQDSVRKLL